MPNQHALLSPSSSERWLHCPKSVRLGEQFEDTTSVYASEGTEAHALCEYLVLTALGRLSADPRSWFQQYSQEMQEAAEGYCAYIMETVADFHRNGVEPSVFVEQRLDMSRYVKECFGTSDCVIIGGDTIVICDFKFGKIPAPATSPQLRIYALGACELFSNLYDFSRVRTVIYQPRLATVDEAEITCDELYAWAENVLAPAAKLAYDDEGEFACGEWCRFCRARNHCRALADHQLELAQYDFKLPPLLSDEEIAGMMGRLDELVAWANAIKEYSLRAALSGAKFDGWKLVEGRANRKYTDEKAVADKVTASGKDPYEHKILGVTAMEKMLGKKAFSELLGDLVERPEGKPVLVPESDKRPEMHNAKYDFADKESEE